jgi:MFS family permease
MPKPADADSPPVAFAGWRILALSTLVLALTGPGQTIGVSVFVDQFADDLGLTKNAIAAGYAIGTLLGSLTLPSVGRWVDRVGVRYSMTTIGVGFTVALALMSGVQGIISLTIGFFMIRMLGQGSLTLVGTVAVSLWFERKRGLALGIAMTVSSGLMALVPVGLSLVIDGFNWRFAWLAAAGTVAALVIPIAWFGMIDRPQTIGQFPDGREPDHDDPNHTGEWGLDRDVAVRTRAFWILGLATALASMLTTALNFHQISLLGESGFSETEAAIMFLPQVLGSSIGSPTMGVLLDRIGTRYAPAATLVALIVTLLLAGSVSSTAGVIVYATVLGIHSGMSRTIGAALIPTWFGTLHIGAIQGALTFLGVLASAAGPIAFSLTESATGSFRTSAGLWALAPAIAFFFALSKRPLSHHAPTA